MKLPEDRIKVPNLDASSVPGVRPSVQLPILVSRTASLADSVGGS